MVAVIETVDQLVRPLFKKAHQSRALPTSVDLELVFLNSEQAVLVVSGGHIHRI